MEQTTILGSTTGPSPTEHLCTSHSWPPINYTPLLDDGLAPTRHVTKPIWTVPSPNLRSSSRRTFRPRYNTVHRRCKFLLPWPKLIISVRGGFSTLPTTAALLGGLAAQEAIKLVTSQYAPLDNTCIVDLVHSTMAKFKL
jgi:hypothetical protein